MRSVSFFQSLQARLILAVVVTMVAGFAVVGGMLSVAMLRDAQAFVGQQQRATVALLASQTGMALEVRFRALEQVASELGRLPQWHASSAQTLLSSRPVLQTLFNTDVVALQLPGGVLARWPVSGEAGGAMESIVRLQQERALAPGRMVWGHTSPQGDAWVLLAVPIYTPSGLSRGYLVGRERRGDGDFVQNLLGASVQLTGTYTVVQRPANQESGAVLAHWQQPMGAVSLEGDAPAAQRETVSFVHGDAHGQAWWLSSHPVAGTDWVVLAQTRMFDALAGMLQRRDQMLLATLGIALLAVGVCWWAIARSLAPMNHAIATLSAQARSQLPGYVQLPTARRDEVGALIAGFNAVLRALEQREQDLLQSRQQQEQQRLRQEAAHRVALVREVHHRIKNNLQGILALMRQHAHRHPELREPLYQAIGQVQSISTLHGLQGRSAQAVVLLCNLVDAIAVEVGVLWACEIAVHRPQPWQAYRLAEQEAVPIALVLYELMLNAVKHGNPAVAPVSVRLSPHAPEAGVEVTICNAGDWAPNQQSQGSGMGLMQALMPRQGARLVHSHEPGQVCVRLHLWAPVVTPHTQDDRAADKEV